jgi:subtilisin family serine protease
MARLQKWLIAVCSFAAIASSVGASSISSTVTPRLSTAGSIVRDPIEDPSNEKQTGPLGFQIGAGWGLDLLDGVTDGTYNYPEGITGEGVDVYVVDTGVYTPHPEFESRAISGKSYVVTTQCRLDGITYTNWDGHGTHVAGIVGSRNYGVAKGVRIIDVRILDNCGNGDSDLAALALAWIVRHHRATRVGIVNMSFGGPADRTTEAMEFATRDLLADNLIPVVAAGNEGVDACSTAPANVDEALTVGALGANGPALYMAGYSNYGSCVDLLAPGNSIRSTWNNYNPLGWTLLLRGTSMAAPFVAGIAALFAQRYPLRCADSLRDAVVAGAATSFAVGDLEPSTTNRVAQLNLVPPARTAPGRVTRVIPVASASGAVTVGWDKPCSGGSPITSSTVRVYRNGLPVRSELLIGNGTSLTITGLANGVDYAFKVRAENALGVGSFSPLSRTVRTGPLRTGISNARLIAEVIAIPNPKDTAVVQESKLVCQIIRNGGYKLVGLKPGICTVRVRPLDAGYTVIRQIVVT